MIFHHDLSPITLLSLFFLLSSPAISQEFTPSLLSKRTHRIAKKIAKYDEITSSHINYAGILSKQWTNFERLQKRASDKELIILMDHPNAAVRGYAFYAILEREQIPVYPILLKHREDNEVINRQSGCIGFSQPLNQFMIEMALFYKRISREQEKTLLSKGASS